MHPVRALRLAQGKSLRQLAAASGGPHFTVIGRIENGMRPTPEQLKKLAGGLNVPPENLEHAIKLAAVEGR